MYREHAVHGLIAGIAALTVVLVAAPPSDARVVYRERYAGTFAGEEINCGHRVHLEGTFHGVLMYKSRLGGTAATMLDNYDFHEVFTEADGDGYILDLAGLYSDLRARLVRGTVYRFNGINVGQVFTIRTLSGEAVERNRGLFEITFLMDTRGDTDPSNDIFYEDTLRLIREAGKHPEVSSTDEELCANIDEAIAG